MLSIDFINNDYEEKKSYSQQVLEQIEIDILTGVLRPNSRIIEDKLCEKYKMSRTPLREILNKLSAIGFVRLIPNRGAFVNEFSKRDLEDYFYLKYLLYPQAVRWAIERITKEEMALLDETFSFMEFYTRTEDFQKVIKVNHGFDAIIYDACHNRHTEELLHRYDFILSHSQNRVAYPKNYIATVFKEHKAIYDAFVHRNPDEGFEAAQVHAFMSMRRFQ